jgi:hypothetical protein
MSNDAARGTMARFLGFPYLTPSLRHRSVTFQVHCDKEKGQQRKGKGKRESQKEKGKAKGKTEREA